MMHSFLEQLSKSNLLNKESMLNLIKPSIHPSVLQYKKTEKEILSEYASALESRTGLNENDFIQLFCEISVCIADDRDFFELLQSCGFSYENKNNY